MRHTFLIFGFVFFILGFTSGSFSAGSGPKIQWFGHSCFVLTSSKGTKVLVDPFSPDVGYKLPSPPLRVDAVVSSHEHFDHNYIQMASGDFRVIKGVDKATGNVNQISETIKDIKLYSVATRHYDKTGSERGNNAVFVFEMDGIRIVHLGDLGHILSKDQLAKIGKVDVLLIPVGGTYTIDSVQADEVIRQLGPKLVIPMHYKTDQAKLDISPIEPFLKGKKDVEKKDSSILDLSSLPEKQKIVVLSYK